MHGGRAAQFLDERIQPIVAADEGAGANENGELLIERAGFAGDEDHLDEGMLGRQLLAG
jgi:hypothetical protein